MQNKPLPTPETRPLPGKEPAQFESAEPSKEDIGVSPLVESLASEATISPEDVEAAMGQIPEQGLPNPEEKLGRIIQGAASEAEQKRIRKFSSRLNHDEAGRIEDMMRKIWPE